MRSLRSPELRRSKPLLSVIVACFNMRREAPRTLFTLSRDYQRDVDDIDYEVIAVDNGSTEPLDAAAVEAMGPEITYRYLETDSKSPCGAINYGASLARGDYISVFIDGARMASPGIVHHAALGTRLAREPVVTTLAWHLGPQVQFLSMKDGYDQNAEDALLGTIDWRTDGYQLFSISTPAKSSAGGWFLPFSESNCITVAREAFETLGGFDERFQTPGGGLANMDYLKRALGLPGSRHILLVGEGTFHQFHGGIATNKSPEDRLSREYAEEYAAIRGEKYRVAETTPLLLGTMPPALLETAAEFVERAIDSRDT